MHMHNQLKLQITIDYSQNMAQIPSKMFDFKLYHNQYHIASIIHFYMSEVLRSQIFKELQQYSYFMKGLLKTPPKGPHIQVTISIWNKDSHGLYDYDAGDAAYHRETGYLATGGKLYRNNTQNKTYFDSHSKKTEIAFPFVAEVAIDKSKINPQFKLKYHRQKQQDKIDDKYGEDRKCYLVVRQYSKDGVITGYPLRPGNTIKLGRVQYLVIESKNQEQTFTLRDTNHFEEANGIFEISKNIKKIDHENGEEIHCKICMIPDQTEEDPLISPCKCKGTCGLIHVGCLKKWINSKVKKDIQGIASSYNFTKFQCQICTFPFPQIVKYDNNVHLEMMTITKPNKPYILLQSLNGKIQNKQQRCLHLISTQQNKAIKIGRGHECEIRIVDISVSRKHAQIILKDGQFYIQDTKAKFGTLIKFEQDIVLSNNKPVKIQCGRTLFQFNLRAQQIEEVDTE